ncbi:hypothetical protein OG989_03965 [Micromonospora sp. NBC_01740]|uniref:hypothetical protein n=1 Tax=Micromonospora sp. NBC_01740 TaxID=2975986 RepID=UPI002E0F1FA5|nr:hypothetical protein OG989_03965 [Micromonospora sp. NBC_01740]
MDFRADLYGSDRRYQRTERFSADTQDEACETARRLTVAHGHDHALLYVCDGNGGATLAAEVGAEQ